MYATTSVEYRGEKGGWQWGVGQDTGLKDTLPVTTSSREISSSFQES